MSETIFGQHIVENRDEHDDLVRMWGTQTAATNAAVLEILATLIDTGVLSPAKAAETAENIMVRLRFQSGAARDAGDQQMADLLWGRGEALGELALPLSTRQPKGD